MKSENSAIKIASFDTLDSAYIALGMLETNGIDCSLLNAVISSVYPLDWAAPELVVNPRQADQARQLLIDGGMEKYLI